MSRCQAERNEAKTNHRLIPHSQVQRRYRLSRSPLPVAGSSRRRRCRRPCSDRRARKPVPPRKICCVSERRIIANRVMTASHRQVAIARRFPRRHRAPAPPAFRECQRLSGLSPRDRIGTGFGGGRSTRISTVGIGAVTMKMISSTSRMSMNGMTFGSETGPSFAPPTFAPMTYLRRSSATRPILVKPLS